jgi:protein phosphatase
MAALYATLAVALAVIGYALRPWGLVLVWPAASLAVIAAAYLWFGPHVFHKRGGRLHPVTRIGLGPYLVGGWLTFPHYRRTAPPWVDLTPKLVLGRRLKDAEARAQVERGVRAVLDLTAECEAPPAFRALAYRNIPILDLTIPTPRQFADAVEFIRAHAADGGKVYLHCKLGRSRSAAVAAAYLIAEGIAKDAEEAVAMVRTARPEVVIGSNAVTALKRYAAQRETT